MRLRVLECPRCGAPLPKRAALVRVVCEYCHSEVTFDRYSVKAAQYRGALSDYEGKSSAEQLRVGKLPIRLIQNLATGHSSDVWRAERASRLTERLVVKILRAPSDEALLRNEQRVLLELEASTQKGAEFFTTLLPQRAAFGLAVGPSHSSALTAVFREPVGFSHTLADLQRVYPAGLDPRHIVWIWRRTLELLGWVHRSGTVHGAVLPAHLLINASEHAAKLVGWSCAAPAGSPLTVVDERCQELYPKAILNGGKLSARTDLSMLAGALLQALGSSAAAARATVPEPIAGLLEREAGGAGGEDAWALGEQVAEAARQSFGPPKFVKLALP